jgi:diacylglycerol kinase family enzyme
MTVLPDGTANNIARTLGLTHRPLEELVQGWPQARRMNLDLGAARGPWGERRFIEGLGIGLFPARISHVDRNQTIESLERGDAIVSYALQLLKEELESCQPLHVEASVDGRDVSGDYLLFEALNIPYVGPNLFLAPDSAQGDGNFDLVMVRDTERERLRHYLAHWQEDKPRLAVLPTMQGSTLSLEWNGFDVHIDDELCRAPAARSRIEVSIEAKAVQVLAPTGKQK